MPEKITWMLMARVAGGPTLTQTGELDVDGYVKLAVTIPNGSHDVEILPGAGGPVQVAIISPAAPSSELSYKAGGKDRALDGPHVLIGSGATSLLGDAVGKLTFTNTGPTDAMVSILVGRDSTP